MEGICWERGHPCPLACVSTLHRSRLAALMRSGTTTLPGFALPPYTQSKHALTKFEEATHEQQGSPREASARGAAVLCFAYYFLPGEGKEGKNKARLTFALPYLIC